MKRIVLGISVLLMLVQNGFAMTDAEYDKKISEQTTEVWKQIWRCNKASDNRNKYKSDVSECLKVIPLKEQNRNAFSDNSLSITYLNIGEIYNSQNDKLNGYKYYMKSAKLGGKGGLTAQSNLNIMCKQSPWACK